MRQDQYRGQCVVSLPYGIFCADGQPKACRHAAGAPRGLVYIVHLSQVALVTSQISICEITMVTLMRLFENKNNTNRHDQFSYHKAGLGGEPYKGETPPDLPVLTS